MNEKFQCAVLKISSSLLAIECRYTVNPDNSRAMRALIEDITRWREDMNFMFEWQEQYLTSERSERVRYCSCHE